MKSRVYYYKTSATELLPEIRQKVSTLENYQTPRTAKEFYDVILDTFMSLGIPHQKKFLKDTYHHLIFKEETHNTPREKIGILRANNNSITACYLLTNTNGSDIEKEIYTLTRPAFAIPELIKDIALGRTNFLEQMPINVRINKDTYPIRYPGRINLPTPQKYS